MNLKQVGNIDAPSALRGSMKERNQILVSTRSAWTAFWVGQNSITCVLFARLRLSFLKNTTVSTKTRLSRALRSRNLLPHRRYPRDQTMASYSQRSATFARVMKGKNSRSSARCVTLRLSTSPALAIKRFLRKNGSAQDAKKSSNKGRRKIPKNESC